ncbi:hypothetical protein TNCV_948531 [Trichonephila clavipes]|nr:hypothetical protein TNCV_948531 [Trichonephila clavipes]
MFESTVRFTDRSSNDEYPCHQVYFKIGGRVVRKSLHGTAQEKFQRGSVRLSDGTTMSNPPMQKCLVQMVKFAPSIMR